MVIKTSWADDLLSSQAHANTFLASVSDSQIHMQHTF